MGGGVSSASSRFSIKRKQRLTDRIINDTASQLDIDLDRNQDVRVFVVNEKQWAKLSNHEHTAAYYTSQGGDIFIRRKYFSQVSTKVLVHENLHARSGHHNYGSQIGQAFEEGTVEYLTQYASKNSLRTKSSKFKSTYSTYYNEVSFTQNVMTLMGRKRYLQMWSHRSYDNRHSPGRFGGGGLNDKANRRLIGNYLRSKGATKTGDAIENNYDNFGTSNPKILQEYNSEMSGIIVNDEKLRQKWIKIDNFDKNPISPGNDL